MYIWDMRKNTHMQKLRASPFYWCCFIKLFLRRFLLSFVVKFVRFKKKKMKGILFVVVWFFLGGFRNISIFLFAKHYKNFPKLLSYPPKSSQGSLMIYIVFMSELWDAKVLLITSLDYQPLVMIWKRWLKRIYFPLIYGSTFMLCFDGESWWIIKGFFS